MLITLLWGCGPGVPETECRPYEADDDPCASGLTYRLCRDHDPDQPLGEGFWIEGSDGVEVCNVTERLRVRLNEDAQATDAEVDAAMLDELADYWRTAESDECLRIVAGYCSGMYE